MGGPGRGSQKLEVRSQKLEEGELRGEGRSGKWVVGFGREGKNTKEIGEKA